jgi:hypothetical protein
MSRLTRTQAEALATFIVRMRDDWSHGGVMAAIERANIVDGLDTARALVNLAADKTATTPALLVKPGPWWRDPTGENMAPPRNSMRCHDHPDQVMPCATCRAELVPATPEQIAGHMAAIRAATASGLATIKDERERTRARGAA